MPAREAQREALLAESWPVKDLGAGLDRGSSRYDLNNVATTARRDGEDYVLTGAKAAVIGAPWADKLIVSARTSGDRRDRDGVSLFVVDRQSANLHLQSFKTIDGRRAAEITLMDVRVPASQLLGREGEGVAALEACRDRAIAALCAEAVGAMTELNSATLEYAKTRKQFGVALGTLPGAAAPHGRHVHRASGGDFADAASQLTSVPKEPEARDWRPARSRRSAMPARSSPSRRSSSMAAWA